MKITHEVLCQYLSYNKETGIFTWIVNKGKMRFGNIAGTLHPSGYIRITLLNKKYAAHRLAWFYVTGVIPNNCIDHINSISKDNRFSNLRDVTILGNMQHMTKPMRNNKSGFLGVLRHKNKWQAKISINGKIKHLGLFDTPYDAHIAYVQAKRIYHPTNTL